MQLYIANYKSNLLKHWKSLHKGETYHSDHCAYKATQKSNLKSHIKSKHEGTVFPCNQCNQFKATYKSNL